MSVARGSDVLRGGCSSPPLCRWCAYLMCRRGGPVVVVGVGWGGACIVFAVVRKGAARPSPHAPPRGLQA